MQTMKWTLVSILLFAVSCDGGEVGDDSGDTDTDTGAADLCAPRDASATQVPETQLTTTYPSPAGGTLADGTYDLARMEVYSPATADEHVRAWRLVVSGDTIVTVQSSDGGPAEIMGGTFAVTGANLDFTITCPQAGAVSVPFSVVGDELWLFDPSEPNIKAYVRQ